jgi:chromosome partitioning protein
VFIDTGPAKIELIEPGIAVAELVLIPTRPSAFDIEQAALAVELCESHGKPHAFVFNHAPSGSSKLLKSSIDFIRQSGGAVLDAHLSFRAPYMAALTVGKSGPEVDKTAATRKEIDALWASVIETLDQKVPA